MINCHVEKLNSSKYIRIVIVGELDQIPMTRMLWPLCFDVPLYILARMPLRPQVEKFSNILLVINVRHINCLLVSFDYMAWKWHDKCFPRCHCGAIKVIKFMSSVTLTDWLFGVPTETMNGWASLSGVHVRRNSWT